LVPKGEYYSSTEATNKINNRGFRNDFWRSIW
jgi:hypothetical protein